jgi:DNA mismatch endonuclease (patch repair protein)
MTDILSKKKRSVLMSKIRSTGNKDTELALAKIFRANKITGWRRHGQLPGKPDFVFRVARVAVFVDGCFWHGCPVHCRRPKSRRAFWNAKIARNMRRDRLVKRLLRKRGWKTVRVWEHALAHPNSVVKRVQTALAGGRPAIKPLATSLKPARRRGGVAEKRR